MAIFYFKSPDYDKSGNIKVTVDNIKIDSIRMFHCGELRKFIVYSMDVSINDGERKRISRIVDVETYDLCEFPISKDVKITIDITNNHRCRCSLELKREVVELDRVVDSYWEEISLVELSEELYNEAQKDHEDYIRDRFKADLMDLLNRYNTKRIGRRGTLTERIQRIYKRYYGHTVPPFKISDLGGV